MEETVMGEWPRVTVVRSRRREPEPESGVGKEALTPAIEVTKAHTNQNYLSRQGLRTARLRVRRAERKRRLVRHTGPGGWQRSLRGRERP